MYRFWHKKKKCIKFQMTGYIHTNTIYIIIESKEMKHQFKLAETGRETRLLIRWYCHAFVVCQHKEALIWHFRKGSKPFEKNLKSLPWVQVIYTRNENFKVYYAPLCGHDSPQSHQPPSLAWDNYSKLKGHRSKSRRGEQGCLRRLAFSQP